ncbi:MAG: AAA family ATPase [Acidobacteria bacterium]|nr:AAA family ATPase [Acidobacteriota bacterium]MBU4307857.1 AAA family ATPase [Acidobacteriota bacterium]MBU4404450.1 AAA family ATPase [Acidobacteriota bacterium]MCG2810995.1 AAA family ATPase [Candidatus Aminicenantes bacterium]
MSPKLEQLNISPEFHPFISNLSDLAGGKERMPFIGRENELEALMETLLRKLKKNIILVGKPGVGKTALITELANRINRGRVPANLRGKVILELSLNQFFYSRESLDLRAKDFEKLFAEIRKNRERIILFLDEMNGQSLGGGEQPGRGSQIQGLLKIHIASRELLIIAAATPEDYYKYIKSDEIMAANFSAILLSEPEKDEMLKILAGVKGYFEKYYGLRIPDGLFASVFTLAQRFIPTRAFPDKAIDLLDIACSKASLKKIRTLTIQHIYQSISSISKLPIEIVSLNTHEHYRGMLAYLQEAAVNQTSALEEISRIIKLAKLETRPNTLKPEGIFLFLGPTGVGKSFVAARIAAYLFGSPEKLRVIDLAGFKKAEDAEKLIRGDEEGNSGILIREIENHPFSVILFENIEAAHASVLYFLGKVLSKGEVVDNIGKKHYLANIIFILSLTGIGEAKKDSAIGFVKDDLRSGEIVISPKIMNVLDWVDEIIQFTPLNLEHLKKITAIQLEKLLRDMQDRYHCKLSVDDGLLDALAGEAEISGRYAHAVSDFIEREIRLPAVDIVTKINKKLQLRVTLEKKRVRVVVVS